VGVHLKEVRGAVQVDHRLDATRHTGHANIAFQRPRTSPVTPAHLALNIARGSRFGLHEAATLYRLGTIHLRMGNHEPAKQHHHEALAMARNFSETQLVAMAL
jgi:hypothetical protein